MKKPNFVQVYMPKDESIYRCVTFVDLLDTMHHLDLMDHVQSQRESVGMGKTQLQLLDHWLWLNTFNKSNEISPVDYAHCLPEVHTRGV